MLSSPCFSKQRACLSAFPHLADVCFDSSYVCCSAYDGDWRETFLDGNRGNRSAVLDWKMENMGNMRGSGDVNVDELGGDDEVRTLGEVLVSVELYITTPEFMAYCGKYITAASYFSPTDEI